MAIQEEPVTIRAYQEADYDEIAALWTRINRELAPADMRELFEQYIATAINGELRQLQEIFSEAKRNAFWVVESSKQIIGTFGIESHSNDSTELRRMYLDRGQRSRGIAQRMLECAELRAAQFGFSKMILSTAEVQRAAIAFYAKSGFRLVRTEVVGTMSTKAVGGGLTRFHFEKVLLARGFRCGSTASGS
jgi:N-acetylglutamate synthase-like GNAT family acetyltransferase